MSGRQRRLCDVSHAEIRSPGYALQVHRSPNKNRKSRGALPGLASMAVASAIDSHGGVAFDEQVKVVDADVSIDIRTAGWPTHLDSFSLRGATHPIMQTQIVLRQVAASGTNFSH